VEVTLAVIDFTGKYGNGNTAPETTEVGFGF